jgi:pilus assembly protein CpaC
VAFRSTWLNALEEKGLARSLAEPNLVALSGDTASFLAGGEYPVPVPQGQNGIGIMYKTYGVGLAFTPTVLNRSLLNLKIEPEVSQLDPSHPVLIGGVSVPPLIVRRASTTIKLRDGQIVIGGLLQNNSNRLGLEEARSFATLIQQSAELGSSIPDALRVYSGGEGLQPAG